jgi:outer membrane protein assembly factor BamB
MEISARLRSASATFCFLLALLVTSAALAAPAVTLAPAVGPPTTSVKVDGTGFDAYAAIDIFFDTADLCLTFANGAGSFSCTIKVPKDAQPQQHWISARQQSTATGAQKAFTVRTDMAQFHGRNALHSGVNPFENTLNAGNAGNLDVLWRKPIGPSGTYGSAVVAGGNVYVGGFDGKLYAFNAKTGAAVAGFPVTLGGAVIYSTPAVVGGKVYVGTTAPDSKLYAFNATNGAPVAGFPKQLGGAIFSTPAVALGNVYVASADGKIHGFNATTGASVPGFPATAGGLFFGAPTLFDGKLFIGSTGGNIYGFDALTGAAVPGYPRSANGEANGTIAAAGGAGYVGSNLA